YPLFLCRRRWRPRHRRGRRRSQGAGLGRVCAGEPEPGAAGGVSRRRPCRGRRRPVQPGGERPGRAAPPVARDRNRRRRGFLAAKGTHPVDADADGDKRYRQDPDRVPTLLRSAVMSRTFASAALALAAALAAPPQAAAETVLRVIPHADLAVIDPYATGTYIVRNYGYLVYDTLFALDHELRPQPQMVESWAQSDDQLSWTFRLRGGLAFHDGQKVRAADVVASLKRWGVRNDTYGQPLLAAAAAIEALDERTFRVVLKTRFPVVDALATL